MSSTFNECSLLCFRPMSVRWFWRKRACLVISQSMTLASIWYHLTGMCCPWKSLTSSLASFWLERMLCNYYMYIGRGDLVATELVYVDISMCSHRFPNQKWARHPIFPFTVAVRPLTLKIFIVSTTFLWFLSLLSFVQICCDYFIWNIWVVPNVLVLWQENILLIWIYA